MTWNRDKKSWRGEAVRLITKTSCHDSKSFFKPPPQNLTCKSMPQLHSFGILLHVGFWGGEGLENDLES